MKGAPKVIETLNSLLADELTAINQYMVHAEMCDNWGYEKLHGMIQKRAVEEMKHAEKLIGRIVFLEGLPIVSELRKMHIGAEVPQMFSSDHDLESGELIVVQLGPFLVGDQQQGDAGFVGFERSQDGLLRLQGGQLEDGRDHALEGVDRVVVQKDFERRQLLGPALGNRGLFHRCRRNRGPTARFRGFVDLDSAVRHDRPFEQSVLHIGPRPCESIHGPYSEGNWHRARVTALLS